MASRFLYVTYIRTTPERLWDALTKPEFTKAYWRGTWHDCDWQVGSSWQLRFPDGRLGDSGSVVECDPPRRLVLSWRNEFRPELRTEGYSRATIELEPMDDTVRLTVLHEIDLDGSKFIEAVSTGWPSILSSLKSLLETGEALDHTRL
ncbi:MAG: SRPBCC family protein [Aliidongia sp.]